MNKGMIVEVHKRHWIVLTSDGCFQKVPRSDKRRDIGDMVSFPHQLTRKHLSFAAVAAAFLILLWAANTIFLSPAPAYAYFSVDINPSLEFVIGRNQKIITATPLNDDGKKLLDTLKFKNKPLDQFLLDLASSAYEKGYLTNANRDILISAIYDPSKVDVQNAQAVDTALDTISQSISEMFEEGLTVSVIHGTLEDLQSAHSLHVSAGKYILMDTLKSEGVSFPSEDLQTTPVSELLSAQPGYKTKETQADEEMLVEQALDDETKKESKEEVKEASKGKSKEESKEQNNPGHQKQRDKEEQEIKEKKNNPNKEKLKPPVEKEKGPKNPKQPNPTPGNQNKK